MAEYKLLMGLIFFYVIIALFYTLANTGALGDTLDPNLLDIPVHIDDTTSCASLNGECTDNIQILGGLIETDPCPSRSDNLTKKATGEHGCDYWDATPREVCCVSAEVEDYINDADGWTDYLSTFGGTMLRMAFFSIPELPFWVNFLIFLPFDILVIYFVVKLIRG